MEKKQYEYPSAVVVTLSGEDRFMEYMSGGPSGARCHRGNRSNHDNYDDTDWEEE